MAAAAGGSKIDMILRRLRIVNCRCSGEANKPLLVHFLEGLLRRLLLDAAGRDAVEAAADCLLALILAEPNAFRSLGTLPCPCGASMCCSHGRALVS